MEWWPIIAEAFGILTGMSFSNTMMEGGVRLFRFKTVAGVRTLFASSAVLAPMLLDDR